MKDQLRSTIEISLQQVLREGEPPRV
jgi:hypothetical protein